MTIADNVVRYRQRKGLSQQELADRVGVRQNTIAAIEMGKTKKSKYLSDIARELDVALTDLEPGRGPVASKIVTGAQFGSRDLPVYASVEAGEGALVMSAEPVDRVARPSELAAVRDAYGVIVTGDSMSPVLRPGFTVWVNPHLPPRVDDLCIFMAERDGQVTATIKEYVGQTKDVWKVRRYQPKEVEFTLKKAEWQRCHVVVGNSRR